MTSDAVAFAQVDLLAREVLLLTGGVEVERGGALRVLGLLGFRDAGEAVGGSLHDLFAPTVERLGRTDGHDIFRRRHIW